MNRLYLRPWTSQSSNNFVTKIWLMTWALNSAVPKESAGADLTGAISKLLALILLTGLVRASRSDPNDDSMLEPCSVEIAVRRGILGD